MSEAKHTQLPWRLTRVIEDGLEIIAVVGPDEKVICRLSPAETANRDDAERVANMELTVRACNSHGALLAACERALQIVGAMADGDSMIEHARAMYEPEDVCRQMHAAIQLAKGDT